MLFGMVAVLGSGWVVVDADCDADVIGPADDATELELVMLVEAIINHV